MQSNSKLTKDQKGDLTGFRAIQKKTGFACVNGVSVVVQRTGANSGRFSVSVASLDEKKIRPKVGEFYARERLNWGDSQPCRIAPKSDLWGSDTDYLEALAYDFAEKLGET